MGIAVDDRLIIMFTLVVITSLLLYRQVLGFKEYLTPGK